MRKTICLLGTLITAGAVLGVVPGAQAAKPSHPQERVCRAGESPVAGAGTCVAARLTQPAEPELIQVATSSRLSRSVCNRLPTKIERDTCQNHVDGAA